MERKDFLKTAGLAGFATLLPFGKLRASGSDGVHGNKTKASCALVPSETAGPYPLNLSGNAAMFRQDIRESEIGAETRIKLRIISTSDCLPIQNARVDIWHCNANGYYSGFTTNGQQGSHNYVGATWCRGIQMTNALGEVDFVTLFPGWYNGRIAHIHFQLFLSSVLQVTSQLAFPVAEKNALYANNSPYSTYGPDPITFSTDNVFSDGYALQLATLTGDPVNGYDSFLEIGINAISTGLLNLAPETGGQFKLEQNYPNPYVGFTTIPFNLTNSADVKLELYDLTGRMVKEIVRKNMASGDQKIELNMAELNLATGDYVYQLNVENNNGKFHQCKMMSAAR